MDLQTLGLVALILVSWGVGAYVEKLASIRIGPSMSFWDVLARVPLIIIFSLIVYKSRAIFGGDKGGIFFGDTWRPIIWGWFACFFLYFLIGRMHQARFLCLLYIRP